MGRLRSKRTTPALASALEASERRLRRMADVLPGLVSYVDSQRRYLFVNSMYERWFGRSREDVVGRTTDDVLGPALLAHVGSYIDRALAGEEVRFETEGSYPGGPRWIDAAYIPDRDDTGRVAGFFVFVMDNTARKEAENALRESEARHREAHLALQIADRRKDELLATISHELRNPLAAIRNAVEVLNAPTVPESSTRWVSDIVARQLQHMSRLLEDLLDVSRVAHDKLILRKARVELCEVVRMALETCRPFLDSASHEVAIDLPPDVFLFADGVRLAQVLSNLLSNAAKYTPRGGHIQVEGERRGDEVMISVRDDGIGIAADLLPRVFEIFAQGARAFDQPDQGLGLGLSLVKGLVELHGGRVEARSAGPGRGSEFRVYLPVVSEGAPIAPAPPVRSAPRTLAGKRVLIADDLRDITESLAVVMRLSGIEVHTANDGEEAVARAASVRPHVVILDIGMPKADGYEACRRIRRSSWGKDVTLIALTGWGGGSTRRQTEAAGFDHLLVKPVEPAALLDLLASL
jgi:PAS domain S-box-containing protein